MRLSRYFLPVMKDAGRRPVRRLQADAARRPHPPDRGRHLCLAAARPACSRRSSRSSARSRTAPAPSSCSCRPSSRPSCGRNRAASTRTGRRCCASRPAAAEMLYGPTNEEMITVIFRDASSLSRPATHALPRSVEVPGRGPAALRGDVTVPHDEGRLQLPQPGGLKATEAMFVAYLRTFARMGLQAVPVRAPTGRSAASSATNSILADTGERCSTARKDVSHDELLAADAATIVRLTGLYAMEEEEHAKVADCPVPAERLRSRRGIEVGHIFAFGQQIQREHGAFGADRRRPGAPADGQLRGRRVAADGRDHRASHDGAASSGRASRRSPSA